MDEEESNVRSDFFVFIHLPRDHAAPLLSVAQRREIAQSTKEEFRQWAETKGSRGQVRNSNNPILIFVDLEGK